MIEVVVYGDYYFVLMVLMNNLLVFDIGWVKVILDDILCENVVYLF